MAKYQASNVVSTVFLICCIFLAVYVRLRLLTLPLERDEGEYAYAGQMLLKGVMPYVGVANMKFPGTYFSFALIQLFFGESITAIRLTLLALNLACIILVYLIARNWLSDRATAFIASGCYALLSVSDSVQGIIANAEQFVMVFVLLGICILQAGILKNNVWSIFLAAIFFGIAVIMKQHGFVFPIFAILWLTTERIIRKEQKFIFIDIITICVGIFIPLTLLTCWLYYENALGKFYELTILYAHDYVSQHRLNEFLHVFHFNDIFWSNPLIWVLCCAGMILCWFIRGFRRASLVLWLLAICSLVGVMPGYYFRQHYFNLILPAAALFAAVPYFVFAELFPKRWLIIAAIFPLIIFTTSCYFNKEYYFELNADEVSLKMYPYEPFRIAPRVADYIKEYTTPADFVTIIGFEPEIYFYSQRRSATSLMYLYPLLEKQRFADAMQQEFFFQTDSLKPAFIVFQDVPMPWLTDSAAHRILDFYYDQVQSYYTLTAVADYKPPAKPVFREANNNDSIQPAYNWRFLIFKREK